MRSTVRLLLACSALIAVLHPSPGSADRTGLISPRDQPSCVDINEEANRIYELTFQRLGVLEALSYVLAPPFGLGQDEDRRRSERSAQAQYYEILELAQLRSCEVTLRNPRISFGKGQDRYMRVGSHEFECVKPNGVRVYTQYRQRPGLPAAEVDSFPPKGPTIILSESSRGLPDVVQMFLYERACEAHRQGMPLRFEHVNDPAFKSAKYECVAIRNLRERNLLRQEDWDILMNYISIYRPTSVYFILGGDEQIRMDDLFTQCFFSRTFQP